MTQEKALELTLAGMLPYGLKIKTGDSINTLVSQMPNEYFSNSGYKSKEIALNVALTRTGHKPLLHSMEKLIKNILEDENDYFYKLNCDLCDILGVTDCEYFVNSIIEKRYYAVNLITAIEALEWLKENHFNLYGLDKEFYIEKSEVNTTK